MLVVMQGKRTQILLNVLQHGLGREGEEWHGQTLDLPEINHRGGNSQYLERLALALLGDGLTTKTIHSIKPTPTTGQEEAGVAVDIIEAEVEEIETIFSGWRQKIETIITEISPTTTNDHVYYIIILWILIWITTHILPI